MKKLISSQRFGMIAEICDNFALEVMESALKKGLTPREATMFALKKRLDSEIELNGMDDDHVIDIYESYVCDR